MAVAAPASLSINILTDGTVKVTVIAILELSLGIIAACIPTCMAFLPFRKNKERQWYSLSKTKRTQNTMDDPVQRERHEDTERVGELHGLPKHRALGSAW